MATTTTRLKNEIFSRLAWSVVIEGLSDAYTTIPTAAAAATAWAGTDWNTAAQWHVGLQLVGTIGQEIKLFDPRIDVDSLELRIADVDDAIRKNVLRVNSSVAKKTFITTSIDSDDTAVTVLSTTGFASPSGTLYSGLETMTYTGTTATTFTGLTRGKYTLWTTSGSVNFARPHRINAINDSRPWISDAPRMHYNRAVWVYLHHYEEDGLPSTKTNALLAWVGRIQSIRDDKGAISIRCRGFMDVLQQDLMSEQFTGMLAQGVDLTSAMVGMHVLERTGVVLQEFETTLAGSGSRRVHTEVAGFVNTALDTFNATAALDWSLVQNADGLYEFVATGALVAGHGGSISLSVTVWLLLGFDAVNKGGADSITISGTTYNLVVFDMVRDGDDKLVLVADSAPVVAFIPQPLDGEALTFDASTIQGTWVSQTRLPILFDQVLPASVDGFLQIGDFYILAVDRISDTSWTIRADVTHKLGGYRIGGSPTLSVTEFTVIKQVWIDRDEAKTIFRKLLFSTGTTDYNYATFDRFGSLGLGIPWSSVDDDSLELLGSHEYGLIIDKPRPFAQLLESLCAIKGLYVLRKNGKITLRPLRYVGPNESGALVFTESNKSRPDEITAVEYASDGIINRVAIKYGTTVFSNPDHTLLIEDVVSETDFGMRRTAEIVAYGLGGTNIHEWAGLTASHALAYFSREIAIIERSYDSSLFHALPADSVLLTDNYVIDPAGGTRGVTNLPCWIMGTSFDFTTGIGTARLATLPAVTAPSPWSPSSRVNDTAANGGLDVATLKTFTVYADKYRDAGIAAGSTVDGFADGDKILIIEWSPADPAAPLKWSRTIDNMPDNLTLGVSVGIGTPAWDATKKYIITNDVYGTVVSTQKNESFIADDATDEMSSGNEAYRWGPLAEMPITLSSPDFTQRFVRTPDTADDTAGANSVHTVHDAAMSANAILAYVTRTSPIQEHVLTTTTVTGTTSTRVYGPVWVPLMGPGRNLLVRCFGRQSGGGTATFDVYTQPSLPSGTSDAGVIRSASVTTAQATTTSATDVWIAEKSLVPLSAGDPDGLGSGCWLWVEAKNSRVGSSAILQGISVTEDGLA